MNRTKPGKRSMDTINIHVRIPKRLGEVLAKIAKENSRSMHGEILMAIREHLGLTEYWRMVGAY